MDASRILQIVERLPPLLRELLLGTKEGKIGHLPTIRLIDMGDNILKLAALFYSGLSMCADTEGPHQDSMSGYLRDMVSEGRGLSLGLSICILKDVQKSEVEKPLAIGKLPDSLLVRWAELRKRVRQVKRIKKLDFEFRKSVSTLLSEFLDNAEFLGKLQVPDNNSWAVDGSTVRVPLAPFFVIQDCHLCGAAHLFAFDQYSKEYDECVYTCWGNGHYSKTGDGNSPMAEQLKRISIDTSNSNGGDRNKSSYLPLFASSYPAMDKLVDLLYEKTEENKETLWIRPQERDEYSRLKSIVHSTRSGTGGSLTHAQLKQKQESLEQMVKNGILIECIEKGPIMVMRNVAAIAGPQELPEYLESLLLKEHNGKREPVEARKRNLKLDCLNLLRERGLENSRSNMRTIMDEVYSIEVAKLIGFPVKDMKNLHNIESYIDRLNREIAELESSQEVGNFERTVDMHWFPKLEALYREMVAFYSYVVHIEKKRINSDLWRQELGRIMRLPFGSLNTALIELNESIDRTLADDLWGRPKIFDTQRYRQLVRDGDKKGDLIGLRNALMHNKSNEYLSTPMTNASRIQVLSWIKRLLDFFASSVDRVFPYEISFTVFSQTNQGIRTCQYITDLSDLGNAQSPKEQRRSQTKIYTDVEIDFARYYYCIPHRRLSNDYIWVDPYLIPMDDVGFNETLK